MAKAADKITQAMQRGTLTPADGHTLMNILESRSRIIERVDVDNRLEKVEEALKLREATKDYEGTRRESQARRRLAPTEH